MASIADQRLYNHQLVDTTLNHPSDVVAWLGAVQAQEYAGAKWALGIRLHGATEADVEQAFQEGSILRTHIMRPTWHLVAPADIRWMLALTAPRVHAVNAYYYRKSELDEAVFKRSNDTMVKVLEGGRQLTRTELATELEKIGIAADGLRLSYLMMQAELDGIICSGGRRGKQFTYALFDERVPAIEKLEPDEALAELAKRYFTSHGPALVQDFVWWSGLTVKDAKTGLQMNQPDLVKEVINGQHYWRATSIPSSKVKPSPAYLLPPYDEYTIAYKDHSATLDPAFADKVREVLFGGTIIIHGQGKGYWSRTISKGKCVLQLRPFGTLSKADMALIEDATIPYSAFIGMPVQLEL